MNFPRFLSYLCIPLAFVLVAYEAGTWFLIWLAAVFWVLSVYADDVESFAEDKAKLLGKRED